jgi:hypothetical protein
VRHTGAVLECGVGVRIAGGLELLVEHVDGVVEKVGVGVAYGDVEFAFEFGTEGGPVALHDGGKVVVVVPVGEDFFVDGSGERVDDLGGIAIFTGGWEDCLPDIPLLGGAAVCAEDEFEGVFISGEADDGAVGFAIGGDWNFAEVAFAQEGVWVVIEVDVLVGVEVDGVRTGDEGAVVEVGIEDLGSEGFPPTCWSAEGGARPSLSDAAIFFLQNGDEFVVDGGAEGPTLAESTS